MDGIPYTVWKTKELQLALGQIIRKLAPGRKIVISEFITTRDPYSCTVGQVVHKMHFFYSGECGVIDVQPYGTYCQKIINYCDNDKLNRLGMLPLTEYIRQTEFEIGQVDTILDFTSFSAALKLFSESKLIMSVDFIIPEDGIPRFLECNKLGATFAEKFDPSLLPIIDAYPLLPQ